MILILIHFVKVYNDGVNVLYHYWMDMMMHDDYVCDKWQKVYRETYILIFD